jgi:hypothetical protein
VEPGEQVVTISVGGTVMTYSVTTGPPVSAPSGGIYSSVALTDGWVGSGVSVDPNTIYAPDESTTGLTIAETTADALHTWSKFVVVPLPAGERSISLYARRVSGVGFFLFELLTAGRLAAFAFDLDNGEVTFPYGFGFDGQTATIEPVFEFYKLTINFVVAAESDTFTLGLKSMNPDYKDTYIGDPGNAVAVWGLQVT